MGTRPNWKRAESSLAALFGTRRRPLSGSNSGGGSDDCQHPDLYLECKYSTHAPLWPLYLKTRFKARAEQRTPVIALKQANQSGMLLVIHSDDLETVLRSWADQVGLAILPSISQLPISESGCGPTAGE